ncbi:class I SAM-dependent methyltransferase [uncultured Winogradskyella sp.]|jgi:hypothetical protein|uniref:class I SAM-dependent methyltransferase n=1 Tax=uncultured Winogradskyella sp. TaxID=395353 RepID=UPI0025E001A8|nr:class I SAM-dependent methyltransferase [uncultured Winogradskyella sp.]
MEQIYDQSLWGGKEFDFYSGIGSHDPMIVNIYVKTVTNFLKSHDHKMTICDIGCGDFNIGQHIFKYSKKYFAIDIVEELIERNKIKFKTKNLEFLCLDIANEVLPKADVIIIRQVLQHLSNNEIQQILNRLKTCKYIILTEHLPVGDFIPNTNKIASQGIRLKQQSGVDILSAPFNFKVKKEDVLNEIVLKNGPGKIKTSLFTL